MNQMISDLKPSRWKVFQVLKLDGENSGENAYVHNYVFNNSF